MKMKVDFPIKKADGKDPIINTDTDKPLTLKDVCINALLTPQEPDDKDGRDKKAKDDSISQKIKDYRIYERFRDWLPGKEIELISEEVARVKKRIGDLYPPLIMGQCYDMLELKEPEGKEEKISRKKS